MSRLLCVDFLILLLPQTFFSFALMNTLRPVIPVSLAAPLASLSPLTAAPSTWSAEALAATYKVAHYPYARYASQPASQSVRQSTSSSRFAFAWLFFFGVSSPSPSFLRFLPQPLFAFRFFFVFVVIVFNVNSHLLSCLGCFCMHDVAIVFVVTHKCTSMYIYIYIYILYTLVRLCASPLPSLFSASCCCANICLFWSWFSVSVWAPFVTSSSLAPHPCQYADESLLNWISSVYLYWPASVTPWLASCVLCPLSYVLQRELCK